MDYARCVLEGVSRDDVGNGSRDDDHFPGQFVSVGKEHSKPLVLYSIIQPVLPVPDFNTQSLHLIR